jgi:signal transduction histidine kinase
MRIIENEARLSFANQALHAQHTISARIKSYTDALRGSASLFQTSASITREQFHDYVAGLERQRHFPALHVLSYAEYVEGAEAEKFERRVRAEQAIRPFGNRVFAITPPGKRAQYAVLTIIEGDPVAKSTFGFDLLSVDYARAALLNSRDSGVMFTAGEALAAISNSRDISLLMRLPVYKHGAPISTVRERRAAYIGSIGIACSVPGLVQGVLDEMSIKKVRMVLTDKGAGAANHRANAPIRVLFDSLGSAARPFPAMAPASDTFSASLPIDDDGRLWNMTLIAPRTALYTRSDAYFPWLAMASGFGGSMLLYALFHTLSSSRSRALMMANEMTRELRESQAKLQVSHQQLRRLVAHADQIKEGERKRIAREIHDDLGQNLLALRIEADLLAARTEDHHPRLHARARMTLLQIDATIKSVRQIINDLRPNVLDLGLSAAVEWQIAEFIRRTGIACELVVGRHDIHLNDHGATAFFRILQESLSNIVRHARASAVRVELRSHEGTLSMTISDNGVGFSGRGQSKPASFGLVGIEERVNILGGAFHIDSAPGHGTTVSVTIPISSDFSAPLAAGRSHSCESGAETV